MRLDHLLSLIGVRYERDLCIELTDLTLDSREVTPGSLFVAVKGLTHHGMDYVSMALASGASAVIYDNWSGSIPQHAFVLQIPNLRTSIGRLAHSFFGDPCEKMHVIGVTGTNGKTTTAHLIVQLAETLGLKSASIGTLGVSIGPNRLDNLERTTPDAITIARWLSKFRDCGVQLVAMEVSSHALDQERVAGIPFTVAVFTNLTRDHLDYHGSMKAYGEAKMRLFEGFPLNCAVINTDDKFGQDLAALIPVGVRRTFGRTKGSKCFISDIHKNINGSAIEVLIDDNHYQIKTSLLGEFNVQNLIGALLAIQNIAPAQFESLINAAPKLRAPPGRMEWFRQTGFATVVIDYAHTPDALQNVLRTCRTHCEGLIWSVFGCGGDRDQGKRALMGRAASDLSDHVVLTTDNPRSELEIAIINEIRSGMTRKPDLVEIDRGSAIRYAIENARSDDWVLIAGKGHESTQTFGARMYSYSDRSEVEKILGPIDQGACHASMHT